MTDITTDPALDEWRTYDEFAAGIDTFRLPSILLAGTSLTLTLRRRRTPSRSASTRTP